MIPKMIHQTAPSDRSRWPVSWSECMETVMRAFPSPEYRYVMWTDEDLDHLARTRFPWFYPIFRDFPSPIYRADAGRYMILYEYGGIYLDMDMEVLRNFYATLESDRVSLVESPFPNIEKVQNSLMASPPRHPFWLEVLREISSTITVMRDSVLDCTGPRMLDRLLDRNRSSIAFLPMNLFNPPPVGSVYNNTKWRGGVYTRHLCTAVWR